MADLNVRNVPDDVMDRLRDQAAGEGVSLSEWVRQTLGDRAALPSAGEMAARRASLPADLPASSESFAEYYRSRLRRRTA